MRSKEAMRILQITKDKFYYLVNTKKLIAIVKRVGNHYEYSDDDVNALRGKLKYRKNCRLPQPERPCIVCGKMFTPVTKFFNNPAYKGTCCSRRCGAAYRKQRGDFEGANNPAWTGTKVQRICLECGKEFMAKPGDVERGYGKYCSKTCRIITTHKEGKFNIKPNKPEGILIELFEKYGFPFKYTGDGNIWIGNHNPDFINVNGKKQVIELFGEYWHPVSDALEWVEHYERYGFTCLIIWVRELSNINNVLSKIRTYEHNKTI